MAGKPVGFALGVVGLFLAAVVLGRLLLAVGPWVLLLVAPLLLVLLSIRGGWRRSLVATAVFVAVALLVWGLSLRPTVSIAFGLLGLLAACGLGVAWKVLRKPSSSDHDGERSELQP